MSDDPKLHKLVGDLTDAKATVFDGTPASMIALLKAIAGGGAASGLTDAQLRASAVPVSGPQTDAQARASAQPVKELRSTTAATASVAGSASAVTILASNANRLGGTISNDSTAILYLLLGAGTASASVYSIKLLPDDYYEIPYVWSGVITGIWASATGNARVTEFS